MNTSTLREIRLQDYQPPSYSVDTIDLTFDIEAEQTLVTAVSQLSRVTANKAQPLELDGEKLELISIAINDKPLSKSEYSLDDKRLIIISTPEQFKLTVQTRIFPHKNTALSGLYQSHQLLCTQCEAHGFRRITYFLDRPDVLARYTTTIIADKQKYPVLLSNGNCIEKGMVNSQRHWVKWQDPFNKPCYLFALVAGDLECFGSTFTTDSGRQVTLQIYVEPGHTEKCNHAMSSLKKAMSWDEQVYGREYDLDIYMIVAVSNFNFGAMENKGLNIFNSKYILAKPESATDFDYLSIEGVVAHEYFHNWTGNRVTCRDWFQLSLKEGLTVFRDQEFSRDQNSRAVNRIQQVNILRSNQFAEDAGPMAHPVRPQSYVEINNFYTTTVYNKGAEVIRMMHTLLGTKGFRKGTDLYFKRHDGQAVTTDDFAAAMADANAFDMSQFKRWYDHAGTPCVTVVDSFDASKQQYQLTLSQHTPATPGQPTKLPFHIPIRTSLYKTDGSKIACQSEQLTRQGDTEFVLELKQPQQTFIFNAVTERPILSALRDFSAPIKIEHERSNDDLLFLLAKDDDGFTRWQAGQELFQRIILDLYRDKSDPKITKNITKLAQALESLLSDQSLDLALQSEMLKLPSYDYLFEFIEKVKVNELVSAHQLLHQQLAVQLQAILTRLYKSLNHTAHYSIEFSQIAKRSLRNHCLAYLMRTGNSAFYELSYQQFSEANNMTDQIAALGCLSHQNCRQRQLALDSFYKQWSEDELVMDKWLAIQAASELPDTLQQVKLLTQHPIFDKKNPNKVRSLLGVFGRNVPIFHTVTGAGYELLADQILLHDSFNPQVAARLISPLIQWKKFAEPYSQLMQAQLQRIAEQKKLSNDVGEIVSKSLD